MTVTTDWKIIHWKIIFQANMKHQARMDILAYRLYVNDKF